MNLIIVLYKIINEIKGRSACSKQQRTLDSVTFTNLLYAGMLDAYFPSVYKCRSAGCWWEN